MSILDKPLDADDIERIADRLWDIGEEGVGAAVMTIESLPPVMLSRRPENRSKAQWQRIRDCGVRVYFVAEDDSRIRCGSGARLMGWDDYLSSDGEVLA